MSAAKVVERLERTTRTIRLGVVDSRIDSARALEERAGAVRVYHAGRVGLASATGDLGASRLEARAHQALDVGVAYAPAPEGGRRRESCVPGRVFSLDDLWSFAESLLAGLRADFPELSFSHAVSHSSVGLMLENDAGLALSHREMLTEVALTVRRRDSADLFDTVIAFEAADAAPEDMLAAARDHLGAFLRSLDRVEEGARRVIFRGFASPHSGALPGLFANDLLAPSYRSGDSSFAGGLESGRRLLSEQLTLIDRRDPARARVCPFDHEGVVRERLDLRLFDRGVLRALASDKRSAQRYGVPATGCAVGTLAELPRSGLASLDLLPTVPGLPELLRGEPGILVWLTMGGEWTAAGELAMPVQVALRLDPDGRPSGRLPKLTVHGELFRIFGDDFLGATEETIDPWSHHTYVGVRMNVVAH